MWRDLARTGALVGIGIFLGRLTGFGRELILAHVLGLGRAADLAAFTLTLPDVFSNLLVGTAIGAALIPEFKESPAKARSLYLQATLLSLAAFGLMSAGLFAGSREIVRVLAPGFVAADLTPSSWLVGLSVWAVPMTAATAVSTAYLQSQDRFFLPATSTLIYNSILIFFIVAWVGPEHLNFVAFGVLMACLVRWVSQILGSRFLSRPTPAPSPGGGWLVTRPIVTRYLEALGSFGVGLLVPVVARALASDFAEGSVASVNYAYKLVEFPLGIAVTILSVVMLPRFSDLYAQKRETESVLLARQGCWLTWMLAVPATLALAWFCPQVVALLFGHGAMTPGGLRQIAEVTPWAVLSLPAQGLSTLFFSILCARKDTARPFRISLALFPLYLAGAWAGRKWLGLPGLMLAGSCFQWALCLGFLWLLRRHHGMRLLAEGTLRDLLLAGTAALAAFVPVALLSSRETAPLVGSFLCLGGAVLSGAIALIPRYRTIPDGLRTFFKAT